MLTQKLITEINSFCESRQIQTNSQTDVLQFIKQMGDEAAKLLRHLKEVDERLQKFVADCSQNGTYSFSVNLGNGFEVNNVGNKFTENPTVGGNVPTKAPVKTEDVVLKTVVIPEKKPVAAKAAAKDFVWPTIDEITLMKSGGIAKTIEKMAANGMDVSALKAETNIRKVKKELIDLISNPKKTVEKEDTTDDFEDVSTDVGEAFEEMSLEGLAQELEENNTVIPPANKKTPVEQDAEDDFEDIEDEAQITEDADFAAELESLDEEFVDEDSIEGNISDDELDEFEDIEDITEMEEEAPVKELTVIEKLQAKKIKIESIAFKDKMYMAKDLGMAVPDIKKLSEVALNTEIMKLIARKK